MEYLKIVDMEEYAGASIGEISGGQQQRVALVRSLITKPKVLLLDEPLSNLDAKLRVKMREEIREIQKKYEITMVFVTHDQEEAMVLGDQIAIMDQGKLVQIGKPEEVYLQSNRMILQEISLEYPTVLLISMEIQYAADRRNWNLQQKVL